MENIKSRQTIHLNEGWDFYLETLESRDKSEYTADSFTQIDNKRTVDLPHDWSIEQEFTKEYSTENESASLPGGIAWYTKAIACEDMAEYVGKSVTLSFGGVYMRSYIYINGSEVASNLYGYNSFDVDITEYFTKKQDIVITVLVINQLPNSRWYSGSGIYRGVTLNITEPVHIAENGIYVSTPDLQKEYNKTVKVRVQNEILNKSDSTQKITIKNEIIDANGNCIGTSDEKTFSVLSGKSTVKTLFPKTEKPELWSTDNPALYSVRTSVFVDDVLTDCVDTEFGFRWLDYDKEKGFLLNGEPAKLKGVCLHHDQGALGASAYTDAILRQLEIMKEMGANAIRTSHNPVSEEFIKLCNRLGLLVIEESFDTWDGAKNEYDFATLFKKELTGTSLNLIGAAEGYTWDEFVIKSMVKRDRNAPCIIMWSLGNEVLGENGRNNSSRLSSYAEELDPFELGGRKKIYAEDDLRGGIDDGWAEVIHGFSENDGKGKKLSVAGVNYVDEGTFEQIHKDYPDILMLSTESSSALRSRGEYFHPTIIKNDYNTDTKATENSQMSSYDNEVASWANTAMFDWEYDISLDYVLGEFVWTGFDYLGEPTPFTDNSESFYPTSSYFGITDTAGFEKDIYYFYQSQWRNADDKPVLHLLPSWDLTEEQLDNGKALVVCYTNAKAVELVAKKGDEIVSLGVKEFKTEKSSAGIREYQINADDNATYKMALEWSVPYEKYRDYTIYAVALDEKGEADNRFSSPNGRNELKKIGKPSKIRLTDYSCKNNIDLFENNYTLHYISVDILDGNGQPCDNYNERISFTVNGNAEIIGVDNGNSSDTDSAKYTDKTGINTFHGKALVIVKAINGSTFTINAKADKMESEIEVLQ